MLRTCSASASLTEILRSLVSQQGPSGMRLAADVGLRGIILGIEGVEVLLKPLNICSRQFAVVRCCVFCVGTSMSYYPPSFGRVRLLPSHLLRQRCDGRNKRGL